MGAMGDEGKMKVRKRRRREPRFCFQTRSDIDVLDDGYKWRKYGQKIVKNCLHPRYINHKTLISFLINFRFFFLISKK